MPWMHGSTVLTVLRPLDCQAGLPKEHHKDVPAPTAMVRTRTRAVLKMTGRAKQRQAWKPVAPFVICADEQRRRLRKCPHFARWPPKWSPGSCCAQHHVTSSRDSPSPRAQQRKTRARHKFCHRQWEAYNQTEEATCGRAPGRWPRAAYNRSAKEARAWTKASSMRLTRIGARLGSARAWCRHAFFQSRYRSPQQLRIKHGAELPTLWADVCPPPFPLQSQAQST